MNRKFVKSQEQYQEALKYIPGGVNSPVRAFKAVGDYPIFIESGEGSKIIDIDGNKYIDYVCSWGPLILGHRHPAVMAAVAESLARGTTFGAPTELEIALARLITSAFPVMDMVRMVNSGTEATMSALRLARAYTGRNKILKFTGCYHGHADSLLVKAGSGLLTLGTPSGPGVPPSLVIHTITASYNDLVEVEAIFSKEGEEIAAVIMEPVAGNMGIVEPLPGFCEGLRQITKEYGALLIFDEVITGFRLAWGGAGTLMGVEPDLTCLGKIIGGGLPVGAYGGKQEIMELLAPTGPVYQAGTLSGNPLAMSAGLAVLHELSKPGVYESLAKKTEALAVGLKNAALSAGAKVTVNQCGSLLTCFFTGGPVHDYQSATTANTEKYKRFFQKMLERGVYLPPSQFEALFLSLAHSDNDIDTTLKAAAAAFKAAI